MDELLKVNLHALNNASNKALNLMKDLYKLSYFDKTNYEKNIKDFGFILVDDNDKAFQEGQFAKYSSVLNKILVKESLLSMGLIDEDYMCILLLHELIHLSSTNREKNMIGFSHEAVPITYNEACTQYLALKLFYKDKIEEGINKNIFYKDSVNTIKESVDALGEEVIFNGFFEADLKKSVDGFTPKILDKWIDYVMVLDSSLEEKISKENSILLEENVRGFSQ